MKPQPRFHWLVRLTAIPALAAVYYGAAELGRYLAPTPQSVTPVWFPNGIALAAVLLLGYWILPGVFVGSFLSVFLIFIQRESSSISVFALLKASSISLGTTLGILLGAYLLNRFVGHRNPFNRPRDTFKFIFFAGMMGPAINGLIGTATLGLAGDVPWSTFGDIWLTWWISHVAGVLIITPVLLVWSYPSLEVQGLTDSLGDKKQESAILRVLEATLLMALVLFIGQIAFGEGYPIEFMLLPLLIWTALRFGQRGATLMILLVSAIAIWATARSSGSFSLQKNVNDSLLLLQAFIGVVVLTTLILTAVITQRQLAVATLRQSEIRLREQARQLEQVLNNLRQTQAQLVHTEKISSLGQLVAGVAHEVNNPVSFITGNLTHVKNATQDLVEVLQIYQEMLPDPPAPIQEKIDEVNLDYLLEDLPKLLYSMEVGTSRIREIMSSLRTFSRVDCDEKQTADIHEGVESTLLILQHRLKATPQRPAIHLVKKYGELPEVQCYAGQLNQVFMNLIANAIDALDEYSIGRTYADIESDPNIIEVRTSLENGYVAIAIYNNGPSIPDEVRERIFEAFYTTKPAGKGTGLGLSISRQIIVEKHKGRLECISVPGRGTEFLIKIPLQQKSALPSKAA